MKKKIISKNNSHANKLEFKNEKKNWMKNQADWKNVLIKMSLQCFECLDYCRYANKCANWKKKKEKVMQATR